MARPGPRVTIPPTVLKVGVTLTKTISKLAYSVLGAMALSVHCPLNIGIAGKAKSELVSSRGCKRNYSRKCDYEIRHREFSKVEIAEE
jgi:hypothetical protein